MKAEVPIRLFYPQRCAFKAPSSFLTPGPGHDKRGPTLGEPSEGSSVFAFQYPITPLEIISFAYLYQINYPRFPVESG